MSLRRIMMAAFLLLPLMPAANAGAQQPMASRQSASVQANGRNVTEVGFGQQGRALGRYRQVGPGRWQEAGNDGSAFEFREDGRDDWSVYLSDPSRGVRIQLDLHRREVLYGDDRSGAMSPIYEIQAVVASAQARADQRSQASRDQAAGNGGVSRYEQAPRVPERNRQAGSDRIRDIGGGSDKVSRMLEMIGADDRPQARADRSVQPSRYAAGPAQATNANGRNVTEVGFGQQGRMLGHYRQVGPGRWQEAGNDGSAFEFREDGRDDWSVYLSDPSRGVRIQLDLHRKLVLYGDGRSNDLSPIYDVLAVGAAPLAEARAPARPSAAPSPVPRPHAMPVVDANGRNVTEVRFGQDGRAMGRFRQISSRQWREEGESGGGFEFEEAGRDDWSVYLQDDSRGVRLQLDLHRKQVLYGDGRSNEMSPIYDILGTGMQPVQVADTPSKPARPMDMTSPVPVVAINANGRNVTEASIGREGRVLGRYRQVGPGRWQEAGNDGSAFEFREDGRDDWSVYLSDPSRGVRIQLDLYRKLVLYGDGRSNDLSPIYDILAAGTPPVSSQPSGGAGSRPGSTGPGQSGGQGQPGPELLPGSNASRSQKEFCWKDSYGRGVGTIPDECGPGRERIGLLCYKRCPSNSRRDPVLLDCRVRQCPNGMRDDGEFCRSAEYARTPYVASPSDLWGDSNKVRCEKVHGKCEKAVGDTAGTIFYPKCRAGDSSWPAGICRPPQPNCAALGLGPSLDLSCSKRIPVFPELGTCSAGEERDAGLCYPRCEAGYGGVGPVCWTSAPRGWVECGMGAARDSATCASIVFGQVESVGNLAMTIATAGSGGAASGAAKTPGRLVELKEKYKQLLEAFDSAKSAIDAANRAKGLNDVTTSAIELKSHEVVTEEDIIRIAAQIAALADPSGVAGVVGAYTYPKCSKYGF